MKEENPFLGIGTCANFTRLWQLTALILLLQVAVFLLVSVLGDVSGLKLDSFESLIPALLATGYVSWVVLERAGVSWRGALADWNRNAAGDLKKAFKYFAGYGLVLLLVAAALMAAYWFWGDGLQKAMKPLNDHDPADRTMLTGAAAASGPRLLLALISACVVAPVVEETFFRRIVYTTLRLKKGFWFSAFWAGLLFALFHGAAAPVILPAGVYLCLVYERERRLPVNILLHSMINLVMVALKMILYG